MKSQRGRDEQVMRRSHIESATNLQSGWLCGSCGCTAALTGVRRAIVGVAMGVGWAAGTMARMAAARPVGPARRVVLGMGLCAGLWWIAGTARSQPAYIFDFLSESKAPVGFRVHGTYYRVPRNYITEMHNFSGGDQPLVVMRVTFPGFKPFSAQTRQCLDSAPAFRPRGCLQVEFDLGPPQTTNAEGYRNILRLDNPTKVPQGPFGYRSYRIGRDAYAWGIFVKAGSSEGEFAFDCIGDTEKLDDPTIGCTGLTKDKSGNAIFFRFQITQLGVADQIQRGLVALVNRFNIGGESEP